MKKEKGSVDEAPLAWVLKDLRYGKELPVFFNTDQLTWGGYIVRNGKVLPPQRELKPEDLARFFYPNEIISDADLIAPDGTIIRNGEILERQRSK